MQKCIEELNSLFKKLVTEKSSSMEQRVNNYTKILEDLVKILQLTVAFLQLQDEYKVNNILLCATQSLTYLKQLRDTKIDSEFERAKREGTIWFESLLSFCSERIPVIVDPTNQERLK